MASGRAERLNVAPDGERDEEFVVPSVTVSLLAPYGDVDVELGLSPR
jgi:hypothetical protein